MIDKIKELKFESENFNNTVLHLCSELYELINNQMITINNLKQEVNIFQQEIALYKNKISELENKKEV